MARRPEVKRVTREQVRNNAAEGAKSGGFGNLFKLPKGVRIWQPEKADSYMIDIVPYTVKNEPHPDVGSGIEAGTLWYKFSFLVHKNVGVNKDRFVSPASFGKPDPIMEEVLRLKDKKNGGWDKNKEQIKALSPQKLVAYAIKDPDDSDKYAIFVYSNYNFGRVLDKELDEGSEENLRFYDVTDEGKTIKVRFSQETFDGTKYLEASRIDFIRREPMDEAEVLANVPCLDEIFNVPTYERLDAVWKGADTAKSHKEEDSGKEPDNDPPPKTSTKKKDAEKEKESETEKDVPKFKKGDKVTAKTKDGTVTGEVIDIDAKAEEITIKKENGKEVDVDFDDAELAPEPTKTGKKAAEKEPETDSDYKVGDRVKDEDGTEGVITEIDDDDITVKTDKGKIVILDVKDIKKVTADSGSGDDLAEGDDVLYKDNDGDEVKGSVLKVKGDQVKVQTNDGAEWMDAKNVRKKVAKGKK